MDSKEKQILTTTVGVKGNVRAITITDNVPDHFDSLISIVKTNYDFWAYIYHDKDDTDKHIHILAICKGGTTLKNHCERFQSVVPANFVCKVKNPRAMAKYLIHKGYVDKFQYDVSEVFTNNKDKYLDMIRDGAPDTIEVWRDYIAVSHGSMKIEDFLDKYRSEFISMPFYQRVSLYNKLEKISSPYS